MSPEDNPADDHQPTKEEWEAYEREMLKDAERQQKYDEWHLDTYGTPQDPK